MPPTSALPFPFLWYAPNVCLALPFLAGAPTPDNQIFPFWKRCQSIRCKYSLLFSRAPD